MSKVCHYSLNMTVKRHRSVEGQIVKEVSHGIKVFKCRKLDMPDLVPHAYNPSTRGGEAGRL